MLPSNRFGTRSRPSKRHLSPWCCSLPLFPDLLLSGSQSGLLARALVRVLQLCVGARLTLNTDLSSSRPCIARPPIDFVGELFFGPASSGATSCRQATPARRAFQRGSGRARSVPSRGLTALRIEWTSPSTPP